jgi:hypothetical protein
VNTATPTAGTANTGGGGGGAWNGPAGATGGSGVVIISYVGAQQFGGGSVTSSGGNTIHTFTTSGTLVPATPLTAQYLIVAGGGSGRYSSGDGGVGGGGAGGLLTGTGVTIDTNSNYVVVVGAGGASVSGTSSNGSNSSWSMVSTAAVGGGGGAGNAGTGTAGGSGGGGGENGGTGGAGTSGQGNAGGSAASGNAGAGGGGAGAVGGAGSAGVGGAGGVGVANSISGTSTYYAGGGGGSSYNAGSSGGVGGNGGGGNGTVYSSVTVATPGTANTGGGGGALGGSRGNTGNTAGGSGIVIIAYPGSTQQMAGGTVTISGGNVIHTFTSSGYLTPIKYASRSLRFRSSANAYLNRTTTSSVTNNKIFTYSIWVKRGIINDGSAFETLIGGGPTNADTFGFGSGTNAAGDFLQLRDSGGGTFNLLTTQLFRDPSAWYHFVLAIDTTQATAANRVKLYVNGVQVTAFSTASYPAQNYVFDWNTTSTAYVLGRRSGGNATWYFDGYMTEVNAVDGQQLTPSSFGTFNSYGVWQPITYGGSYGTNGFYLTFGNNTSTTTLGYDTSPQGNNWTTNNISLTAGVTYDSMTDVPTLTSATVANYATWNPLARFTGANAPTISNGNLLTTTAGNPTHTIGTMAAPASGKFYFEITCTSIDTARTYIGFLTTQTNGFASGGTASYNLTYSALYSSTDGGIYYNTGSSANAAYGATYTTGDVIGIAYDNGKIWWSKNGVFQASGNPATGANPGLTGWNVYGDLYPYCGYSSTFSGNFGQQPFTYSAPSGFVALNTYNLSTPTIPNGAVYMAATTYTGTGAALTVANTVNGTNFQPDFVWIKNRTNTYHHTLQDVVRGFTTGTKLASDGTYAEGDATELSSAYGYVSSASSSGFTTSSTNTSDFVQTNKTANNYVAWQWKANGTGVSNTSGSITSTVSANTTAGFAVVTYTGTGANATVGHGLGVAPSMMIFKNRTSVYNWAVYHASIPNASTTTLELNNADAATGGNATTFNSTAPTSSVFSLGTNDRVNRGTNTFVAYVFAAVAGYSAFGSYTGNGSTDGPFVFCGFRPRFVLVKNASTAGKWVLMDTSRGLYNEMTGTNALYPNLADAEGTDGGSRQMDFLSNGFKLRCTGGDANGSGNTIIYMAFAENPFKYSNAR